jgi:hypothetical protein
VPVGAVISRETQLIEIVGMGGVKRDTVAADDVEVVGEQKEFGGVSRVSFVFLMLENRSR